jgi:hypothetical protein
MRELREEDRWELWSEGEVRANVSNLRQDKEFGAASVSVYAPANGPVQRAVVISARLPTAWNFPRHHSSFAL